MRAKSINEIKREERKSSLSSIGVGNVALKFARELERAWPEFNKKSTLDRCFYVKELFYDEERKAVLDMLGTKATNVKRVKTEDLSIDLLMRLNEIMNENGVVETTKNIPHSNYRKIEKYDEKNDIFRSVKEKTNGYHNIKVSFLYNPFREVLLVRYTDDEGDSNSITYVKMS